NSIDHGIETSQQRKKSGKNKRASITLSAAQAGNQIVISVKDDGKGIDLEKVKSVAVKNGLISLEDVEKLPESKIFDFIFEPGFSTSATVTDISGRGVGLDAVKDTVTRLSGYISINTKKSVGTEFINSLPLTLAISSVILVRSSEDVFAIPILDINETLDIHISETRNLNGKKIINLRDEVLPLINLNDIFNKGRSGINQNDESKERLTVIVVSYGDKKAGLIVDEVLGRQEIVLKPLDTKYNVTGALSGAAILGDGSIILVVDIPGVISLIKKGGYKEGGMRIRSEISEGGVKEKFKMPVRAAL
ncbi:MAG: chemotaxis protein CheW, partial [Actinomycetia bacterium]|nr:chemotaxis protein CheW [Actinomycetes bacterium]